MSEKQENDPILHHILIGNIRYDLNCENKTAIINSNALSKQEEIIIQRSVTYESVEYIIIGIGDHAFDYSLYLKTFKFAPDSEVRIIESTALSPYTEIISLPSSVTELQPFWCHYTPKLTKISIDPKNPRYTVYDDKMIIGKTSLEQANFDVLIFYSRDAIKVIIPSFIKTIASSCFSGCEQLNEVEIPENSELQTIEKSSFDNSTIEKITISKSVIDIKKNWDFWTPKLTKIIISPENPRYSMYDDKLVIAKSSIENENYDVLLSCVHDIEIAEIPNFIEVISECAFENCTKLRKVVFQDGSKLQKIEDAAFFDTAIESISFPPHLKFIGKNVFLNCKSLEEVKIPIDSELQIIDMKAFCDTNIKSIYIPRTVQKIGEFSFVDCEQLEKVEIPINSELQIIDEKAFACTAIENILIPPNVTKICYGTFHNCSIKNVYFSQNSKLESIENEAFESSSIESISIPSSVTQIGEKAFNKCKELKKIEIPLNSELKTIGNFAFAETQIESFTIPSKFTEFSEGLFYRASKLTKISVCPGNPRYSIYENKLVIAKSSIENENFDVLVFCVKDIESITVPSFIEQIMGYAFEGCQLKQIEFTDDSKLRKIGECSFSNSLIENIKIPHHVKTIEGRAFSSCRKLKNIEFADNSELQSFGYYCFGGISIKELKIPESSEFLTIEKSTFLGSSIEKITISSKIKKISEGCFENYTKLKEFSIPKNSELQIIEKGAFDFSSIKKISLPIHLKEISESCFERCRKLQEVEINENSELQIIGKRAFSNSRIRKITIPSQLKKISERCFSSCVNLHAVVVPNNSELQSIDEQAFFASSIVSIFFPENLTYIEKDAFRACYNLRLIEIDEKSKLKSINSDKFSGCQNLSIMVPANMKIEFIFDNNDNVDGGFDALFG